MIYIFIIYFDIKPITISCSQITNDYIVISDTCRSTLYLNMKSFYLEIYLLIMYLNGTVITNFKIENNGRVLVCIFYFHMMGGY